MTNNPIYLPEEILIQIFSKLPAKAVGRFKCLSKTWCAQLSSTEFLDLHFLNRPTSPEYLLLLDNRDHSLYIIDGPIVYNNISRELDLGEFRWNAVWGSCNGLVLLSNRENELFLVNPNTLQLYELAPFPLSLYEEEEEEDLLRCDMSALCYDGLMDDYMVVVFTYADVAEHEHLYDRFIHVYHLKSDAWDCVSTHHQCHCVPIDSAAFVNGAVHGSYYSFADSAYIIEAYDLADGLFHVISPPPVPPPPAPRLDALLVLQGCLSMSMVLESGDIEIWMMKQYRLPNSWTRFTIASNTELRLCYPLYSIGDREIVLRTYANKLVLYNLRDGTMNDMVIDGVPTACHEGVPFVDSLVSPIILNEENEDGE